MRPGESPRLSLAEILQRWFSQLLEQLGEHRVKGLYRLVLEQVERVLIEEALARAGGRHGRAADILGLHRNSLRQRMRALGLGRYGRSGPGSDG